ncbi:glutathione S-transferase [Sphingomonas vulcanisoli]|uniref:Glutathione S-transferase n=1 Tax=Sphingomonas vulcanisoli TaxID=1658060 RepID=A0ABX0TZC3_9SPHN|nr:glutathione S-transferase family protein [Sphingomonas vulcanisoli]NIJ09100.1 glutathione S-transferase [Sphingomonas vulcanisoli]
MLRLYAHPFSSYCWKVLIAVWENDIPFEYAHLEQGEHGAELAALSPLGKMPLLVDGTEVVPETTIIIEYLQLNYPGPVKLIPDDRQAALEVRKLDRLADNYLANVLQIPVWDAMRPEAERDFVGVAKARADLVKAYDWWESQIAHQPEWAWAQFSLADCAAAPALFYADWVQPFAETHPALYAYRQRLLARPSIARAVEEARPYRAYFPLGAPDRD